MTSVCTHPVANSTCSLQDSFLVLLPQIRAYARKVFRNRLAQERQELIAETIAWAWKLFLSCSRRGKNPMERPSWLLRYSALAVKSGRRLGRSANSNELFRVAHLVDSGTKLLSLSECAAEHTTSFNETLIDRRAFSPANAAAARIDVAAWLRTLSTRDRHVAHALAHGDATGVVARTFRVSPARISQLRGEFEQSWQRFQAQAIGTGGPAPKTILSRR
jgi:hypothetical protein